jgi:integrase
LPCADTEAQIGPTRPAGHHFPINRRISSSWPGQVRPIDPRSLNKAFDRLLNRAGLTHARIHDLRHTCASLLLHEGASEREIMELLGHSSINITMNTYAHVLDDAKRRLADRMDNLFGPTDVDN